MKAKNNHIIAIDLGSNKIACIVAEIDNSQNIKILNKSLFHSKGIRGGIITDFKKAEESILHAIFAVEKEYGSNIKKVSVALSGINTRSQIVNVKIPLLDQKIFKQDIVKLTNKAILQASSSNNDIIHYFPLEYSVDNHHFITDPEGMFGKELGGKFNIVTAETSMLLNIANCLAKCQIEISNFILGVYASAVATLNAEDSELGSLIIDLGSKMTSFGVIKDNNLLSHNFIPIGSDHITHDIAKAFSIPVQEAEKIKILHGDLMSQINSKQKFIHLKNSFFNDEEVINITQADLYEVIYPRVEEIFEFIKKEYDHLNIDHLISRRLILTGGGASLRGIKELAAHFFQKQVRIGKPLYLKNINDDYNLESYITTIGIVALNAAKMSKYTIDNKTSKNFLHKMFSWLKENV